MHECISYWCYRIDVVVLYIIIMREKSHALKHNLMKNFQHTIFRVVSIALVLDPISQYASRTIPKTYVEICTLYVIALAYRASALLYTVHAGTR